MTTSPQPPNQPDQPQPRPTAWTNPADAPPPFPNVQSSPSPGYDYTAYDQPRHAPLSNQYPPRRPVSSDDRLWAIMAHLSAVIAWAVSAGWLNIVGPLIVYVLQKDKSPFVRNASAGAFNFALSMWLVGIVGWLLTITVIGALIGIPLIIVSALGSIIFGIVGAVKTANNEAFVYPMQLKVLS